MRSREEVRRALHELRLHGLSAELERFGEEPWLHELLDLEQAEKQRRSLENRKRFASLGSFKSMSEFQWNWPKAIARHTYNVNPVGSPPPATLGGKLGTNSSSSVISLPQE